MINKSEPILAQALLLKNKEPNPSFSFNPIRLKGRIRSDLTQGVLLRLEPNRKSLTKAALKSFYVNKKKYRKAEYVQRCVCFINVQSSLHENVVFSVSARTCIAAYVIFIMWNSISGLDTCYHFRLNISRKVAVTVRSHQKNIR